MAPVRYLHTLAALAVGNLRASRGRAIYLFLTLAITTAAWLILAAMGSPYVRASNIPGITIRNGSQRGSLPLGYAPRIEAIRGARDVFWYGIQAVKCSAATMVPLYAFGGPGTDSQLARHKVPAATIQRWNADPLAAVKYPRKNRGLVCERLKGAHNSGSRLKAADYIPSFIWS